jgi:hypothetical protein
MGDKDPEALTREEVAEMASHAGIKDTEHTHDRAPASRSQQDQAQEGLF